MDDRRDISTIATLVGDRTRARMLTALMDGRALTATELALEGGVTPSTASSHLTRLTEGGLLSMARQGRHRYFRVAGPDVAAALEGLMRLAPRGDARRTRPGPREPGLRRARVCYDHLAGELAVTFLERLLERGILRGRGDDLELTPDGESWCGRVEIEVDGLRAKRRPVCLPCLDWSERRFHLAGALGASLLERMFALRYLRREPGTRVVIPSPRGESFLERLEIF